MGRSGAGGDADDISLSSVSIQSANDVIPGGVVAIFACLLFFQGILQESYLKLKNPSLFIYFQPKAGI